MKHLLVLLAAGSSSLCHGHAAALRANEQRANEHEMTTTSTDEGIVLTLQTLIKKNGLDMLMHKEQEVVAKLVAKYDCNGGSRDLVSVMDEIEQKNAADGENLEDRCKQEIINLTEDKTTAFETNKKDHENAASKAQEPYLATKARALKKFNAVKATYAQHVETDQQHFNSKEKIYNDSKQKYDTINNKYHVDKARLEGEMGATERDYNVQLANTKDTAKIMVGKSEAAAKKDEATAKTSKTTSTTLCTETKDFELNNAKNDMSILRPLEDDVNAFKLCGPDDVEKVYGGKTYICRDMRTEILATVDKLTCAWSSSCLLSATLSKDDVPLNTLCVQRKGEEELVTLDTHKTCTETAATNFVNEKQSIWDGHNTIETDWINTVEATTTEKKEAMTTFQKQIAEAKTPTVEPKAAMETADEIKQHAAAVLAKMKLDEAAAVNAANTDMNHSYQAAEQQKMQDEAGHHNAADLAFSVASVAHKDGISSNDKTCKHHRSVLKDEMSTVNQIREKIAKLKIRDDLLHSME